MNQLSSSNPMNHKSNIIFWVTPEPPNRQHKYWGFSELSEMAKTLIKKKHCPSPPGDANATNCADDTDANNHKKKSSNGAMKNAAAFALLSLLLLLHDSRPQEEWGVGDTGDTRQDSITSMGSMGDGVDGEMNTDAGRKRAF